jgi:hypothetical protein
MVLAYLSAGLVVVALVLALHRGLLFVYGVLRGVVDRDTTYDRDRVLLEDEKRRVLGSLREIRFDLDTGKLSKEDHAELRVRYEEQAASIFRRMDALEAKRKPEPAGRQDA